MANGASDCLYAESRRRIQSSGELADSELSAVQYMLKNRFPLLDGLRGTAEIAGYVASPCVSEFVQIVYTGGGHWECMSNVGLAEQDNINIYDSIFTTTNEIAEEGTCRMLMTQKRQRQVYKSEGANLKQTGSVDCGLFAAAVATSVCFGTDPSSEAYEQEQMQPRLLHCLESEKMTPFPTTNGRAFHHQVQVHKGGEDLLLLSNA